MEGDVSTFAATYEQPRSTTATLRILIGASAGHLVEWYDYAVYAYTASVIAKAFFPSQDPTTALLSSFAVFGVAFVVRPLGGLIWGPLADRLGRRNVLSLVLIIMAAATFAIGCLPQATSIGIWAPVLLVICRLIQGFSLGGEMMSAYTYVAEHMPAHRRGFFVGWVALTGTGGFLLGSATVWTVTGLMDAEAFQQWGWRVGFWLALPLAIVGIYIRSRLEETPAFQKMQSEGTLAEAPLKEGFAKHKLHFFQIVGLGALHQTSFYFVQTYLQNYAVNQLKFTRADASAATTITLVATLAAVPLMGWFSDVVGRKKVLLSVCLFYIIFMWPIFWLMNNSSWAVFTLLQVVLGVSVAAFLGAVMPAYIEMVPIRVRVATTSIAYNIGTVLFGSTALYVSTYLVQVLNFRYSLSLYVIAAAVITLIAVLSMKETAPRLVKTE